MLNREKLVAALQSVQPGLASKAFLDQDQSFVFSNGRVRTCNDMVAVSHPLPEGGESLEGAVRAEELLAILSRIKAPELDLVMQPTELQIRTSTVKAGISREAENRLLDPGTPEEMVAVPEGLLEALSTCQFSASRDLSVLILCQICLRGNTAIASDNLRITICEYQEALREEDLLVPASVVPDLVRLNATEWGHTDGWEHWRNAEQVTFSHRSVGGGYKDMSRLMEVEGTELEFPPGLAEAVGTVVQVLEKKDTDPRITLEAGGGVLVVKARGPYGWAKERLKMQSAGEATFEINPDFLLDAIKHHPRITVGTTCLKIETESMQHVCLLSTTQE